MAGVGGEIEKRHLEPGNDHRNLFWGRLFLNPYAFTALEGSADTLRTLADELRNSVHA